MYKLSWIIFASTFWFSTSAMAQGFDDGLRAFQAQDYKSALHEFKPLADKGFSNAQAKLGEMHEFGLGVLQNYSIALRWYELASSAGSSLASYRIGVMHYEGKGMPKNSEEAQKHWKLAAFQKRAEDKEASERSSELRSQRLLEQKRKNSEAAFMGDPVAQRLHALSFVVTEPEDLVSAHMWLNIASANGEEQSAEYRDMLAARMSAKEIQEAQNRAALCLETNYQNCE